MDRVPMHRYEDAVAAFRWRVPDSFNFGGDVVDFWAQDAEKLALIWCDGNGHEERLTFADIGRLSNQFANALATHGVKKGDRVLVMLPRIPAWQIAMIGCLKLGAVPVPCIEMLTAKDIAYRVEHAGAKAAITTSANITKFEDLPIEVAISVGGCQAGWRDFDVELASASRDFTPAVVTADDPAVMYYTSGSTGEPKGVLHPARVLFAWRVSAWYWNDLRDDDLMWCTADTGWSKAGSSILFGPWSCGSAVLFYDGPFDAERRFELLEKYRVTVFCAAATELRRLVDIDAANYDLSALRLAISAGETVNPEIVERWRSKTGVPLLDGYGQTETLMTIVNYPTMPVKPGAMGRPLPGTAMTVLNDDNRPVTTGTVGQLAYRLPNPQFMLGYWRDDAQTEERIVDVDGTRYFLTGDMAYEDEDGYFFYQGRADDVINSAGYRIGPLEVENALMAHPAVQECAAVASPDPDRGEVVKAFVVLRAGHTDDAALVEELQDHAKCTTAPYKYPRKIEFVEELPKTVSGKIRRRELRDREFGANP